MPYAWQICVVIAGIDLLPKLQVARRGWIEGCVQFLDSLGDKIVLLPEQQLVSVAKNVLLLEQQIDFVDRIVLPAGQQIVSVDRFVVLLRQQGVSGGRFLPVWAWVSL